ncbi:hypothetical protein D5086_001047 [Populus alba]|uniref:Uncharacterized protein n=1 Tax=Populus alba TaxID=43335 RepID=A0ACC4CXM2_POPAL
MSFPTINDSDKMLWHPGLIFWMLCFWHTTRCRVSDVAAPVVKVVGVQRQFMDTENRETLSGGQSREAGTRTPPLTRVRCKQGAFSFWVHMRRSMELAYGSSFSRKNLDHDYSKIPVAFV